MGLIGNYLVTKAAEKIATVGLLSGAANHALDSVSAAATNARYETDSTVFARGEHAFYLTVQQSSSWHGWGFDAGNDNNISHYVYDKHGDLMYRATVTRCGGRKTIFSVVDGKNHEIGSIFKKEKSRANFTDRDVIECDVKLDGKSVFLIESFTHKTRIGDECELSMSGTGYTMEKDKHWTEFKAYREPKRLFQKRQQMAHVYKVKTSSQVAHKDKYVLGYDEKIDEQLGVLLAIAIDEATFIG